MISDDMPTPGKLITDQVRYGAYSKQFSKFVVFDPNKITEINYGPGGHVIQPQGEVNIVEDESLKLLHYKYLGGLPRLQARWDQVGLEISDINTKSGLGVKRMDSDVIGRRYRYVKAHAELVVDSSLFSWKSRLLGKAKQRDKNPMI
jgi:hypothetical protein